MQRGNDTVIHSLALAWQVLLYWPNVWRLWVPRWGRPHSPNLAGWSGSMLLVPGDLSSLTLERVTLPQIKLVHYLWDFPGIIVPAQGDLCIDSCCAPTVFFSGLEDLDHGQCVLHGLAFQITWKLQLSSSVSSSITLKITICCYFLGGAVGGYAFLL